MSSSTSTATNGAVRSRVLRGGVVPAAPSLSEIPHALGRELDAVSHAVQAWSPEQVAAALAEGYRAGHEQGLAEGHAEGMARGLADSASAETVRQLRAETALQALEAAATSLDRRQAAAIASLEENLVDTALAIAEAVLQRELRTVDTAVSEALTRGLALAPPHVPVVARLNPTDLAALTPSDPSAPGAWVDPVSARSVRLVADDRVEHGGCIVEAGDTTVDAQLGPAIARARAALLGLDAEELTT